MGLIKPRARVGGDLNEGPLALLAALYTSQGFRGLEKWPQAVLAALNKSRLLCRVVYLPVSGLMKRNDVEDVNPCVGPGERSSCDLPAGPVYSLGGVEMS